MIDNLVEKHTGVRTASHREFVKTGLLDAQWGRFYNKLFEDSQEGDHIAFIEFELDYVKEQLARRREFLSKLGPLISSLSNE